MKQYSVTFWYGDDVKHTFTTPTPHLAIMKQWLKNRTIITGIRVKEV